VEQNSKVLAAASMALDEQSGSFCSAEQGLGTDRRRRWTFVLGGDGLWTWQMTKPDGAQSVSTRSFGKLTECTADAVRHGYVVWHQDERRQQELDWQQCQPAVGR
jgi:hypothetical protein